VTIPDIERARVKKTLDMFCDRVPPHARDQIGPGLCSTSRRSAPRLVLPSPRLAAQPALSLIRSLTMLSARLSEY
jgi:hypothetical protein